jgi:hypothetical protein
MHVMVAENQLGLRTLWSPMPTHATRFYSRFFLTPLIKNHSKKSVEVVGMKSAAVATK